MKLTTVVGLRGEATTLLPMIRQISPFDNASSICYNTPMQCSVNSCIKDVSARGFCPTHYWRWQQGKPLEAPVQLRRNNPTEDKRCRLCGVVKPTSEYTRAAHNFGGHDTYCKTCGAKYREQNRQKLREIYKRTRDKLREETRIAYGGVCACCGETRSEFLSIDHINGGGNEERRRLGAWGGINFYRKLRQSNWPPGYRVLCHNCNQALGHYGYCPHVTETGPADTIAALNIQARADGNQPMVASRLVSG